MVSFRGPYTSQLFLMFKLVLFLWDLNSDADVFCITACKHFLIGFANEQWHAVKGFVILFSLQTCIPNLKLSFTFQWIFLFWRTEFTSKCICSNHMCFVLAITGLQMINFKVLYWNKTHLHQASESFGGRAVIYGYSTIEFKFFRDAAPQKKTID